MAKSLVMGFLSFFIASTASAYDQLPGDKFFSIEGITTTSETSSFIKVSSAESLVSDFNLLNWSEHDVIPPKPTEKYVRLKHFGSWIKGSNGNTCFDTRGLILARDSKTQVEVSKTNHCRVAKGTWVDPYTNNQLDNAKDIQIDHVVPLKEAYVSGAYKWTWKKRCAYANFTANTHHLIAVDGKANMQKSDSGPDRWMPPNNKFTCEYIRDWLRVKAIWKLMMSESEVNAISQIIKKNNCDTSSFKMTESELKNQRDKAVKLADLCPSATASEEIVQTNESSLLDKSSPN